MGLLDVVEKLMDNEAVVIPVLLYGAET